MKYEWSEAKAASNLAKHKVSFDRVSDLDWDHALVRTDLRSGEPRLVALVPIENRLHVLVFVIRRHLRVISLRCASNKEIEAYEQSFPPQ